MIEQIYSEQAIQTGLAVKVDGLVVEYAALPDKYAYRFFVDVGKGEENVSTVEAYCKITEVAYAMIAQAKINGQQWSLKKMKDDNAWVKNHGQYFVDVEFYINGE